MGGEVILVCVTGQRSSARLIHRGAELARAHDARLLVLSVSGSGMNLLEKPDVAAALDELYRLSGEVGAEMTMLYAADAHRAICDFAKARGVTRIVLGAGAPGASPFVNQLMRAMPSVAFTVDFPTAGETELEEKKKE